MSTVAGLVLAVLAIVMLLNLANGTLRAWLKAKFLHIAPPASTGQPAAATGLSAVAATQKTAAAKLASAGTAPSSSQVLA